jgi:hypothetical protein
VHNGHIKRITDEEIQSSVLEIMSSNVSTTFITCPADPQKTLGIKLPFLVMIVKVRTAHAACAVIAGLHQASCCMLGMSVMELRHIVKRRGNHLSGVCWGHLAQHTCHFSLQNRLCCLACCCAEHEEVLQL